MPEGKCVQCKRFPDMKKGAPEFCGPWHTGRRLEGGYVNTRRMLAWLIKTGEKMYVSVCVCV